MKVKAEVEKTDIGTAEFEVDEKNLLEYINNGGEYHFESLDAARAGLDTKDFHYVLREFLEYEMIDDNPHLDGIQLVHISAETRIDKIIEVV